MKKFSLQYITPSDAGRDIPGLVEKVCSAGCRWVQLRLKNCSPGVIENIAQKVKEICNKHEAVLIINDYVSLVKRLDANGVHLGKKDMCPGEARKILGKGKVIGASVNSPADVERVINMGIDYLGIGPFRFTETKQKLAPVLGLQGYREIIRWYQNKGYELPWCAIGGIRQEDTYALLSTGIDGIAVSSAISDADNPVEYTRKILHVINMVNKQTRI